MLTSRIGPHFTCMLTSVYKQSGVGLGHLNDAFADSWAWLISLVPSKHFQEVLSYPHQQSNEHAPLELTELAEGGLETFAVVPFPCENKDEFV